MHIVAQILFVIAIGLAVWLFSVQVKRIRRNILLGKEANYNDNPSERWKNLFLLAFGQKKMFRKPLVAFMHFVIYAGFIIINIEVLEIVLDGIFGTHRLFSSPLGGFYRFLINAFEVLALGVLIVCVIFLCRRNLVKVRRLIGRDLNGWPKSDANYILVIEIVLMALFLAMNASDTLLQQRNYGMYAAHPTGNFLVSTWLHPLLSGVPDETLAAIERSAWWLHILGILAFLNYLPYSKHLHILLAFPNAYYTRLRPKGQMKNMPEIQNEVLYAMQPELAPPGDVQQVQKFGARDVFDLSWRDLH